MKRTLFPKHAIFYKALILSNFFIFIITSAYAQPGAKWATGGTAAGAGDILGTTTNYPILFHTNNTQKMSLGTDGVLQLNNLMGIGNRLMQTDANGKIIPFPMGDPLKVLYGNGTWGALPTIPTALWSSSGYNVYHLGYVGIGTNSPTYPLDVIGDARISNNLYVGGGIVITDKVNANSEVKTGMIKTDSIVTDSTKGFYGTTKFNGDIKLSSKLNVDGEASIGGTLKLLGGLTFIGLPPASLDPCVDFLAVGPDGTVVALDATADLTFDPSSSPCPEPPIVPFTWQTWGNHVNHDLRWIGTIENFDFRIKTNSALRMIVKKDGKVGIGIINPTAKFEIQNDNPAIISASISKVESSTQTRRVIFEPKLNSGAYNNLTQANDAGIFWTDGAGGVGTNQDAGAGFVIAPWSNTTAIPHKGIRITSEGNVGIGTDLTSNPNDYRLAVNGMIGAKEFKIEISSSTWPDFVFETNYKRMTLLEKETFYLKEKHLPNIASKKEIAKNGLQISTVLSGITQNVEENTLDIVELSKKIIALENENQKLKKQIEKLEK
ncbi:MAG TPA: hypothetical protein VJI69_10025 [Bacteroidia bacterium]|nr:hypothetical protein [Bacteroidia bacterium]